MRKGSGSGESGASVDVGTGVEGGRGRKRRMAFEISNVYRTRWDNRYEWMIMYLWGGVKVENRRRRRGGEARKSGRHLLQRGKHVENAPKRTFCWLSSASTLSHEYLSPNIIIWIP